MKNIKHFARLYVEWVIRLGRVRSSLLGLVILSAVALCTQIILSLWIVGQVHWSDVSRSIVFGLISAPVVLYFFSLLVERLENSRKELSDLVEQLRQEVRERVAAETQLSEAVENLEKTNRDKSTLMATISHELRTPLNGIIGLSRILLDESPQGQNKGYLQTIYTSAVSLSHIFSDIIDLGKADARRIELNNKPTDMNLLLNDISTFALLMAQEKKLQFDIEYRTPLPSWLMLDSVRLSQVLWNLINNAIKFTEQGKVVLSLEQTGHNQFSFSVQDTGIGISKADIGKIFQLFYQVQESPLKNLGSGIGLSISKSIAQLMGGDLTVQSEFGKGSIFTLTFQAETVAPPANFDAALPNIPNKLRVLLVEDIEVNVIVAKSVLEKLNYQVDVAMTGQAAIDLFEQNDYDLLLLDIQLPDMSGVDVAAHLQRNYTEGRYDYLPPLVALTANVMQSKQQYLAQGMDDVLRKPLAIDELTLCLQKYFGEENVRVDGKTFSNRPALLDENQSEWLDLKMLNELTEMLGLQFVQDNLALFEQTMPSYLAELKTAFTQYQQDANQQKAVREVAHKIKGALGSVGLKKARLLAAQIQNAESPQWQAEIENWLTQLETQWLENVQALRNWLDKEI